MPSNRGHYREACAGYERLVLEEPSWDNLARLAHLRSKMGDIEAADQLYAEAEDNLTAKQMRSYAWVELQRGLLDVERGNYREAEEHYRHADSGYSGYWLVQEHRAALFAASGALEQATEMYDELAHRVPKPELAQALGKLYSLRCDEQRSKLWYRKAELAFLESARAGDVHYYHHLSDLYLQGIDCPPDALYWARKDWELRDNYSTQSVLALALLRNGQVEEAATLIDRAIQSGVADTHVLGTAAHIYRALGREDDARTYSEKAHQLSPVHSHFHVHH